MVRALGLALWFGCRMQAHIGAVQLADAARYWEVLQYGQLYSTTPVPMVLPLRRILELLLPSGRALAVHACAMEEGKQAASEREGELLNAERVIVTCDASSGSKRHCVFPNKAKNRLLRCTA